MAKLYRIEQERYLETTLSGLGARMVGGRWNLPGHPAVYTSYARSLTVLEKLVHMSGIIPQLVYYLVEIEIDDGVFQVLEEEDLPEDWQALPTSPATQRLGDTWLRSAEAIALEVPSVIIPAERNVLLNPLHPDFAGAVRKVGEEPFSFDPRLRPGVPAV